MQKIKHTSLLGVVLLAGYGVSTPVQAQSLGMYGTTGLIDMPTAESQEDAQLAMSISYFGNTMKSTLTFQATPRLSGSFRYSGIKDFDAPGDTRYDRSFDFQYRLLDESTYMPAVAIGMRDFLGTSVYSSEYIVATKHLTPTLTATLGAGWGRLSNSNDIHTGIDHNYKEWFDGPVGAFGGIEWQTPIEGLTFKAEYSSDKYVPEAVDRDLIERDSPFNFGIEYTPTENLHVGLYHLYGNEVGFRLTAALNPRKPIVKGTYESAPLPVTPRSHPFDQDVSWMNTPGINARGREHLTKLLKGQGVKVEALALTGSKAELRIRNTKYNATPQAVGRAARAMAYVMPDSISTFVITPVEKGLPLASVVLDRHEFEHNEAAPNGPEAMWRTARFEDPRAMTGLVEYQEGLYPKLTWSLSPYVEVGLGDQDAALRANLGLRAEGRWDVKPGLSFAGSVTKKIVGNLGDVMQMPSALPRVRSDLGRYQDEGDPAIEYLTGDYLFKLRPDIYARLTAGYLEPMFAGVQGEVLWKPVNQAWGLGAEVAYAKQRDFDQLLGLQDYSIVTGHVSAYYQFENGFHAQLDVGRYLAGDWGATVSVDRTFANGWSVGAYATLTDAEQSNFGEGDFDKGIRMSIPLSWAVGTPSRTAYSVKLRSAARDDGARLEVNNRLYSIVQDYHRPDMETNWGRFWR